MVVFIELVALDESVELDESAHLKLEQAGAELCQAQSSLS